ncbi:MAG: PTS transporter subunit EIIA [Lentisphaerae bacterium]|nr:PTS transporter subunit EIIA [Lentisphaerota bacterium]
MILTLKELAEYLRVNERTILRMLKTGQIQGAKIGGQWRFNGGQIDRLFFPNSPPGEEDVPLHALTQSQIDIPISRMLNEDRINLDLQAGSVEEVISELVMPKVFSTLVLDINDLREKCLARENILSTGVGNGIAVPHPRDPIPTLRAPGCVIVGRSSKGVDYKAVDGKPVKLFFLLCSQNIELHLHMMGCMARMLVNQDFVQECFEAKEKSDVIKAVMEFERADFLNRKYVEEDVDA